ncbi:MAG: response regulator [Acidimicrobiales bacterium]|nr:response regulator [Acidimicrobiales bacterium]
MAGITCHRCGRTGESGSLDWSSTVVKGETRRLCGPCTRRHVRDIETKLDEAWWTSTARPVLVVEDDLDTRLLIRMSLETAGYVVDEVATGEDALRHLERGAAPTAIVVDIGLPGSVGGWDVCDRARALPDPPPVIVISPASTLAEHERTDDVDYLRKPFEMDSLVDLVGRRAGYQAGAGLA